MGHINHVLTAFSDRLLNQYRMSNSLSMEEIFSIVVKRVGTNGRRNWFSIIPMACNMAFTPAGLPSTNNSLNSSLANSFFSFT